MLKELLLKKMLKSKGVPAEQVDPLIDMMRKNPGLFQTIAEEVQERLKKGGDQMQVTMEVMQKYQSELKKIFPQQ